MKTSQIIKEYNSYLLKMLKPFYPSDEIIDEYLLFYNSSMDTRYSDIGFYASYYDVKSGEHFFIESFEYAHNTYTFVKISLLDGGAIRYEVRIDNFKDSGERLIIREEISRKEIIDLKKAGLITNIKKFVFDRLRKKIEEAYFTTYDEIIAQMRRMEKYRNNN